VLEVTYNYSKFKHSSYSENVVDAIFYGEYIVLTGAHNKLLLFKRDTLLSTWDKGVLRLSPSAALNSNFLVVFSSTQAEVYSLTRYNFEAPITLLPLSDEVNVAIDETKLYVVTRGWVKILALKSGT
jgi:hypothetical protein